MVKQKQAEQGQQQEVDQQEEARKKAQEELDHNLRFYNKGRELPADAIKPIVSGRLKGKSDVNPMWRMKRMTEIFGPIGFGWKYVIDKQWTETYGTETKCFCNVLLYVRDPETKEWSEPIPGCGGSSIVTLERNGAYVNDEGYKMALTDALSIAMKPLGIGANIWYGPKANGHNESKYEEGTRDQSNQQASPGKVNRQVKLEGETLQRAIAEINAVRTQEEFSNIWNKWACEYPKDTLNGSPFWNAGAVKMQQLNQSR